MTEPFDDVPSPIDFRRMADARQWTDAARGKPWRTEFFARIADEFVRHPATDPSILELGSGPGFLAELRHKRHAPSFYRSVGQLVRPGRMLLACDHFAGEGGRRDAALYMTPHEHERAHREAGFLIVEQLMVTSGLILFSATNTEKRPLRA